MPTIPEEESLRYKVIHDIDFDLVGGEGSGAVDSVNGATGVVTLAAGDIGFTPVGTIAATDVQAAIAEAASEAGGFAPASRYEAGGADPIGDTGPLVVVDTLQVLRADVTALLNIASAGFSAEIGADALSATGQLSMTDATITVTHYQSDGSMVPASSVDLGDTYADLTVSDPIDEFHSALSHLWLHATGNELAFFETGIKRVELLGDGTGLSLYDATANTIASLAEGANGGTLTLYDETGADPQVLDHDSLATVLASTFTNPMLAPLAFNDGVNNLVTIGTGLGIGPTGVARLEVTDATVSYFDATDLQIARFEPGYLSVMSADGNVTHTLDANSPEVGFFGVSPYGQDAYLAPLDDALGAGTILVDLITAVNADRTRINAINGYLIARGWEAAS